MRLLLTILLLFCSLPASAQVLGEQYEYEVQWGYADVARVKLQRGCPRKGYVPAKLSAKTLGVANQIHAFEIVLDSFMSANGQTFEGRTFIEEEGVPRRYKTRFNSKGTAFTQKQYKKQHSSQRLSLKPGTHDLLSWFFALRSLELKPKTTKAFYVWDGWKLTKLWGTVGKRERVWTPSGTFEAHPVELRRVRLHHATDKAFTPSADPEKIGTIWLLGDSRRTPVAMDFKAPVGLAKLRLVRQKDRTCP